jgi:hypothetical protein
MAEPHAAIGATDVGPIDVHDIGLGPIRLGAMLFTMIEPHRDHVVAYNRWYERDHLYAGCTIGPYNFAAKRWVATRVLKELRHLGDDRVATDPMVGSYLSLYWLLEGWVQEWNRWAFREFRWLHDNGRMFPHRDHVHTLLYTHDRAHYRDDDPVPASLALDHPFAGLGVVIGTTPDREAFDAWAGDELAPTVQGDGSPVAITLSFTGVPLQVDAKDVARDDAGEGRFLHLHFLDADPLDCWHDSVGRVPDLVAAAGMGTVSWAGPFIPTVPGTDRYTDQLW